MDDKKLDKGDTAAAAAGAGAGAGARCCSNIKLICRHAGRSSFPVINLGEGADTLSNKLI